MSSDMYCGVCPICDEDVDHSEAGFCDHCKQPFHWSRCGTWIGGVHSCNECETAEDGE